MGRRYTISDAAALTAAGDILETVVGAGHVVKVHQVILTQKNRAGDASSEQHDWSVSHMTGSTPGSGGATPTAQPISPGDSAYGGTVGTFNTNAVTGGTERVLYRAGWNNMAGDNYLPKPDGEPEIPPGDMLLVKLLDTPAASTEFVIFADIEEMG